MRLLTRFCGIPIEKFVPISVEAAGIKDFANTPKTVTFSPEQTMQNVTIELVTDDINESQEGFFLVMEIDQPESPNDVTIDLNVTLGKIIDDDGKH